MPPTSREGGGGIGYKTGGGGGQVKFYPYKKMGRVENVLAMLKGGGGTTGFKVVFMQELEVLAILMGGTKSFRPLKGGA